MTRRKTVFKKLREDIRAVIGRDPAARGVVEVICCYPGLHAIWAHRVASFLWRRRCRLSARMLAFFNRFLTGIEIHPGARIGHRLFIDHGAGVVIGETVEIGDDVLLYQGAVLGGTTYKTGKRHPTVGNNVVVGTGAVALGDINIGDGARIGSGSVVIKSVPPGATVIGVPGRVVEEHGEHPFDLEHGRLPDPVAEAIRLILREQTRLEGLLENAERQAGVTSPRDELRQHIKEIMDEFS